MSSASIWSTNEAISEHYPELIGDVRNSNPLHFNIFGDLVAMDYQNAKRILADTSNFKNFDFKERFNVVSAIAKNDPGLREFGESLEYWLLFMNGEKHLEHRRFINQKLNQTDFEALSIQATNEIISSLQDKEEVDLVDVSRRFSFLILSRLIDLEEADYDFIQRFSHVITLIFEKTLNVRELMECSAMSKRFHTYLSETLTRQEREESQGLLMQMKEVMGSSRIKHLIGTWEFLANAATETTTLLLSKSIATLIEHKDLAINWESHNECAMAVEELIRYTSPVNWIPRQIVDDMEYEGFQLKKGKTVLVGLASANRDPLVFPNPNTFIPNRKPNPHIGFGFGLHHCLGARLSRLELQKFFPRFVSAFPNIRFNPSKSPEWDTKVFFRGYKRLPVLLK